MRGVVRYGKRGSKRASAAGKGGTPPKKVAYRQGPLLGLGGRKGRDAARGPRRTRYEASTAIPTIEVSLPQACIPSLQMSCTLDIALSYPCLQLTERVSVPDFQKGGRRLDTRGGTGR